MPSGLFAARASSRRCAADRSVDEGHERDPRQGPVRPRALAQGRRGGRPAAEPWSDDPTQWLFEGRPEVSTAPLQVAVARLVGYRWPEQAESDDLDAFADADGIVCLPSVAGEAPAADRLQQVLAAAFGEAWSPAKVKELLEQAGSKKKNLADWLRDEFFKQHCALFGNRPFVWHIWDGQRDGFSALVNYHRLDRKTLEKLTYTYLGQDWVERQRAEVRDEVAGAEARLAAALELQRKLEAILEGEAPFDIYVRWKELHEQPIGWEPDLNDGVRLNIRPFVEAGVLRVAVQHPLEEGPRQEPRRLRAAQRPPPLARREARRHGSEPAERERDRSRSARRAPDGGAGVQRRTRTSRRSRCCGPTRARSGSRSSTASASALPLVSLGDYDPRRGRARRTGCAVSSPARSTPGFPTGRRSCTCRASPAASCGRSTRCPPELAPIAELQYRSQWFSHPNGRDWTVRSLLSHAERGLGLQRRRRRRDQRGAAARAGSACSTSPSTGWRSSCSTPTSSATSSTPIRSAACSAGSTIPQGFRPRLDDAQWAAFVQQCKADYGFDPDVDGEITAARKLGEREGSWAQVWKRFAETPERYPGIPERLRQAKPMELFVEHSEAWPQDNEVAEDQLRSRLRDFEALTAEGARKEVGRARRRARLAARHGLGRARPGAARLRARAARAARRADRAAAGRRRSRVARSPTTPSAAGAPTTPCCARSRRVETHADREAVSARGRGDVPAVARRRCQGAPGGDRPDGERRHLRSRAAGVDGDGHGHRVRRRPAARRRPPRRRSVWRALAWTSASTTSLAALPTVTQTAKPALVPVPTGALDGRAGPARRERGDGHEGVDPGAAVADGRQRRAGPRRRRRPATRRARHGPRPARSTTVATTSASGSSTTSTRRSSGSSARIRELLDAGWQRVDVVTDHGWILLPGRHGEGRAAGRRRPRSRRAGARGSRTALRSTCRRCRGSGITTSGSRSRPGVTCFEANKEYEHGGVSPQECIVPRLAVTRRRSVQRRRADRRSRRSSGSGLLCRIEFTGVADRRGRRPPRASRPTPKYEHRRGGEGDRRRRQGLAGRARRGARRRARPPRARRRRRRRSSLQREVIVGRNR